VETAWSKRNSEGRTNLVQTVFSIIDIPAQRNIIGESGEGRHLRVLRDQNSIPVSLSAFRGRKTSALLSSTRRIRQTPAVIGRLLYSPLPYVTVQRVTSQCRVLSGGIDGAEGADQRCPLYARSTSMLSGSSRFQTALEPCKRFEVLAFGGEFGGARLRKIRLILNHEERRVQTGVGFKGGLVLQLK
jgi:hypothetical protein